MGEQGLTWQQQSCFADEKTVLQKNPRGIALIFFNEIEAKVIWEREHTRWEEIKVLPDFFFFFTTYVILFCWGEHSYSVNSFSPGTSIVSVEWTPIPCILWWWFLDFVSNTIKYFLENRWVTWWVWIACSFQCTDDQQNKVTPGVTCPEHSTERREIVK